jgi:hypothetical protein
MTAVPGPAAADRARAQPSGRLSGRSGSSRVVRSMSAPGPAGRRSTQSPGRPGPRPPGRGRSPRSRAPAPGRRHPASTGSTARRRTPGRARPARPLCPRSAGPPGSPGAAAATGQAGRSSGSAHRRTLRRSGPAIVTLRSRLPVLPEVRLTAPCYSGRACARPRRATPRVDPRGYPLAAMKIRPRRRRRAVRTWLPVPVRVCWPPFAPLAGVGRAVGRPAGSRRRRCGAARQLWAGRVGLRGRSSPARTGWGWPEAGRSCCCSRWPPPSRCVSSAPGRLARRHRLAGRPAAVPAAGVAGPRARRRPLGLAAVDAGPAAGGLGCPRPGTRRGGPAVLGGVARPAVVASTGSRARRDDRRSRRPGCSAGRRCSAGCPTACRRRAPRPTGPRRPCAGSPGGAGRAGPHRAGDARRGGPPHVDDRGARRDRAVPARRRQPVGAAELAEVAAAARQSLREMQNLLACCGTATRSSGHRSPASAS